MVVFYNQGRIRGAFHDKKIAMVKNIINWIVELVNWPFLAVCLTKKDAGYHKGELVTCDIMKD